MRLLLVFALAFSRAVALSGQTGTATSIASEPAEQAIFFKNFTARESLPHGLVNLIFEDSRGFLWLSAQTGLVRYDGFAFTPIFGEGSGKALIYSEVLSMAEDETGQLWASTNDARLLCIRPFSTDFSIAGFDSLAAKSHILQATADSVWLVAPNGVFAYCRSAGRFSQIAWDKPVFANEAARQAGLPQAISGFAPDARGGLWLGGQNAAGGGLYRWEMAGNRWAYFPYAIGRAPEQQNLGQAIDHIFIDPADGAIYCSGWSGSLRRYLPAAERWETFLFHNPEKHAIHFILPKNEREFWLGTERGISVFDKKNQRARDWAHTENDPNSLLPQRKICACAQRNGSIWFGGTGGASCINPRLQAFARREILPPGEQVEAFFKDTLAGRTLWATGSDGRNVVSIFCLDERRSEQKARRVFSVPVERSGVIGFILRDRRRDFYWVGTEKGLYRMDAKTFHVSPVRGQFFGKKPFDFAQTSFWAVRFDLAGALWLGTYGYGILRFDGKNWQQWLPESTDPDGFYAREILCDRQGRVWAGSRRNDGLAAFDPAAGRDLRLDTTAAWRQFFRGKSAVGLAEDAAGALWAGTSAGLLRCHLAPSGAFEVEKIPQVNEAVFYLAFDSDGRLWMKTNSGVQRLDPRTGAVQVFNEKSGLAAEFSFGRFYRADDGEFFFGENHRWRAEDIAPETAAAPRVALTAVRLFDQMLAPEKWASPGQILCLTHRENALVFEFSALGMAQPAACRYHWQLRGPVPLRPTDGAPGEHRATFTNLPPGDYQFEVWADAAPSTASRPSPTLLAFRIAPPFWATGWFRALAGALAAALLYFFYRSRLKIATAGAKIQQQRAEMREKEAEFRRELAEMEIAALRAQMNPHFIFNLLGTLESFIAEGQSAAATEMLQKFSRLTRCVLENSARPLVPLADDLAALRLYIELEQARFDGVFRVEWDLAENLLSENPDVPPLLAQPFVENAILHGLRNKRGGDKWLKINVFRDGGDCVFEISDNGVGRRQAAIFAEGRAFPQHSLGAKLTERRIQLAGTAAGRAARVEVRDLLDNQADTGTVVVLRLPVD